MPACLQGLLTFGSSLAPPASPASCLLCFSPTSTWVSLVSLPTLPPNTTTLCLTSRFPPRTAGSWAARLISLGQPPASHTGVVGCVPPALNDGFFSPHPHRRFQALCKLCHSEGWMWNAVLRRLNRHVWDSEGSCPSLHHIAAVQQSPSICFTHLTHV